MVKPASHDLELPGCTPDPLMAYLKSLGIVRLVGEQKDTEARGWWRNDVFWLRSAVLFRNAQNDAAKRSALVTFLAEEYRPTPIVAPWAGGSGFFNKDNKKAVQALGRSTSARTDPYRSVIESVQAALRAERVGDKPRDDDKVRLIRRYRRELPDQVVAWIDAAMILQRDGQRFAPMLGTGGNDGRLDFTQNFMQRVVALGLHNDASTSDKSAAWLAQALFSSHVKLDAASVGQFAPGRAGGPNATQGMEGDSTDNPWDFVLMMEGALVLAGAAVRRLGVADAAHPAFPFTVRAVAAGFDSPASKDEGGSRGELWLPLWTRPTCACELRQLFAEGRAEVAARAARDGADFARAVAGLGVDRGIAGFSRLGFLKRSGKAFLAAPLGRFEVVERPGVDLLREVDSWLDRFRLAAGDRNAPPRFGSALHRIHSAIIAFCRYGGPTLFQRILREFANAERALGSAERFREARRLRPLTGLSPAWIEAAADGSAEFTLARALATIYDSERRTGPLRANLEPVDWQKQCRVWAERDRCVVWNAADLATSLASVLGRRMMDGARAGCERLPLASSFSAPLKDVGAFIAGHLNDQRLEGLIWGLMLVNLGHGPGRQAGFTRERHDRNRDRGQAVPCGGREEPQPTAMLPREYALLKLLFLPWPLVPERTGEKVHWRLARPAAGGRTATGLTIRPEPRILPLVRAGRTGEACRIAAQRLRVSGLSPMPGPLPTGVMRDGRWSELADDPHRARRLAAALLIPVSSKSVNRLVDLVCRNESAAAEACACTAEGES